jgi:putative DNA primase/helicase
VTLVTKTLLDGTILPDVRKDLLNVADFINRGWSVIPLRFRSKRPALPSWLEFQKRHATFEEIDGWAQTLPVMNVGIVTGMVSQLIVIDADSDEAMAWALENMPHCDLRVRTAKGVHLYYACARPIKTKVRTTYHGTKLEIDIKATGGYVVAPGSVHPSGHVYTREGEW